MDNYQEKYQKYVNGVGTRYEVILDSIRKSLKDVIRSKEGVIIFNEYEANIPFPNEDRISIQAFPLFEEIVEEKLPTDGDQKIRILEKFNAKRVAKELVYFKHYGENRDSDTLYTLKLDCPCAIVENLGKNSPFDTVTDFLEKTTFANNDLDFLFFNNVNGKSHFKVIPITFLTSPCVLIFIPVEYSDRFEYILNLTQGTIDHYLIDRLITEMRKDLTIEKIKSEDQLLEEFIKELARICIPAYYQIEGKDKIFCFEWINGYTDEFSFNLILNLNNKKVNLNLPSFKTYDNKWMHALPIMGIKSNQIAKNIENIFELELSHWKALNNSIILAHNVMKDILFEKGLKVQTLLSGQNMLDKIGNAVQEIVNMPHSEFVDRVRKIEDNYIDLTFDNSDSENIRVKYNGAEIGYCRSNSKVGNFFMSFFKQILNESISNVTQFDCYEEIKQSISKNRTNQPDSEEHSKKESLAKKILNEQIRTIKVLQEQIKNNLGGADLTEDNLFEYEDLNYLIKEISTSKKIIDDITYNFRNINVTDLNKTKKYVNDIHNILLEILPEYNTIHKENQENLDFKNLYKVPKEVTDSNITTHIYNNYIAIFRIISKNSILKERFSNHIIQSGLDFKSNKYTYNNENISLQNELKFDFRS